MILKLFYLPLLERRINIKKEDASDRRLSLANIR